MAEQKKKKVLVVEDERNTRQLYRTFFGRYSNVDVFEAEDGIVGFKKAREIKPDLIMLDNRMPNMSGEGTARMIRNDESVKNTPIIMVSALALSEREIEKVKLDVNEYLQQPFNPWHLQQLVEKYLGTLIEI